MALFRETHTNRSKDMWQRERLIHLVRLVPEAVPLVGLLILGVIFDFPAILGLLAGVIVAYFSVRMTLLLFAERQLAKGAYTRADWLVRWALRLNPWSTDALVLQAQGLSQRGEDEDAEHLLRHALDLAPGNRVVQHTLAATVLAQGRLAEGWKLASDDVAAAPRAPQVAQHRAWLALHAEENPAKARLLILDADPYTYSERIKLPLLATLADAHIALGARAEATETLNVIERELEQCPTPQQAELLYHLGRLHQALGEDGTRYFRASVERDPAGRYAQAAWRSAVNSAA